MKNHPDSANRGQQLLETDIDSMAAWMQALDASRRGYFLALLSHEMTVSMRVMCYESQSSVGMIESIRTLNEAHHRVAGYLVHLTSNTEDTVWLKSVAAHLAICPDAVAKRHLEQAWDHARSIIER